MTKCKHDGGECGTGGYCDKCHHEEMSMPDSVQSPMRRVVCAALRNKAGAVLLGIRHYSKDMHEQIAARTDGESFKHLHGENQGFVDQFGVYMIREEALLVAEHAGQILSYKRNGSSALLRSEGIY